MHVIALKNVVQTGAHKATKDKASEVPEAIAKEWIAAKIARAATEAEIKAAKTEGAK